jgi:hypothetical protein
MKNDRGNATTHDPSVSIWCQRCSIRIAPYDQRLVKSGKVYHKVCYSKMMNEDSKGRK